MDKELFELCRDVYKRTGWKHERGDPHYLWSHTDHKENGVAIASYFIYTSDYLLEKLPPAAGGMVLQLTHTNPDDEDGWQADYTKFGNNHCFGRGDTALKALLKLTIALHEAGELK